VSKTKEIDGEAEEAFDEQVADDTLFHLSIQQTVVGLNEILLHQNISHGHLL
jgi:hypothetical protein